MTDERDSPSAVAHDLIRALESEAELVDAGAFTFDLASAREKLAEYRLANPHAFVLLLVEAAHLLPGCSEIAFSISPSETRVRLTNAGLDAHEIESLADTVFVDLGTRDLEARRRELGRQRLALAIDAARSQPDSSVELHGVTDVAPALSLVFGRSGKGAAQLAEQQRALLQAKARYATLPVLVDDWRVEDETPLEDVIGLVEIRSAAGAIVGHAGWSAARAEATAILVANGVILEELHEPDWQPGFVALVDVGDLRRDLSLAKLVRDGTFAARRAAIRAVHDALPPNPTTAEVFYAEVASTKWQNLGIALGLLAVLLMFLIPSIGMDYLAFMWLPGVFLGVPIAVHAWTFVEMQRAEAGRARGLRAIGVLESSELTQLKHEKKLTITLQVSVPDQLPFRKSISFPIRDPELDQFQIGRRFHLRIDRQSHQHVWLDPPPRDVDWKDDQGEGASTVAG